MLIPLFIILNHNNLPAEITIWRTYKFFERLATPARESLRLNAASDSIATNYANTIPLREDLIQAIKV